MDNQSNDSEPELPLRLSHQKKPQNRNKTVHKGLTLHSQFSGGNLKSACFQQQYRLEGRVGLVIQFWGNSDAQVDPIDKCWFYFIIEGINEQRDVKYDEIIFRFKNANVYRRFVKDKKYKPYVVMSEERGGCQGTWNALYLSKINILQNEIIESQFVYTVNKEVHAVRFAQNLPYTLNDLDRLHQQSLQCLQQNPHVYYHKEIIAESVDGHQIAMLTITSQNNILTKQQNQTSIFQYKHSRPYLLKNKPQIVFTARVHPSEVCSSFCVEGILEALMKNEEFLILLQVFVFRIVPMMNPDGVENGHYRLDNFMQNLNRFYGHSDSIKTPSIYAVEKMLVSLRDKNKLFMFIDIHGHNSPKPAFIFGNFCQHFYQTLENKTFIKLMQLYGNNNFDSMQCEFSKKHMKVKQKYDEHSKQASARVFAYRGYQQQDNNHYNNDENFVEHSYTLEVHPYVVEQQNIRKSIKRQSKQISGSYKNLIKTGFNGNKNEPFSQLIAPNRQDIINEYKQLGESTLLSILDLIGASSLNKCNESMSSVQIRKKCFKDLCNQSQFYDRTKILKSKQINKFILERYSQKWNILEGYKQHLSQNQLHLIKEEKVCPLHELYEQWMIKKQKNQINQAKRAKFMAKENKQKQKQMQKKFETYTDGLMGKDQHEGILIQQELSEQFTLISFPNPTQMSEIDAIKGSRPIKQTSSQLTKKVDKLHQRTYRQSSNNDFNFSPKRKVSKYKNSEGDDLESKVRQLIFRHKTQSQIAQETDQNCFKKPFQVLYQVSQQSVNQTSRYKKKTFSLKQAEKNYMKSSKLEPLKKQKKNNLANAKTEDHADFSDQRILQKAEKIQRKTMFGDTKREKIERINPRIQQFVRKLSIHRQTEANIQQYVSNKSTNKISERNKSLSRGSQFRDIGQNKKVFSRKESNFQSNMILPPMNQIFVSQDSLEQGNNSIFKGRMPGCHKSVKTKAKKQKMQIAEPHPNEQQIKSIVRSFKTLTSQSSNKIDFVKKAKRMLSEKKKQYRTIQQANLPMISELQFLMPSKKNKN